MSVIDNEAGRRAIRGWIDSQHEQLDRGSYYTLLGIGRTASEDEVRTAYYHMVARFHPDLYGDQALDPDTRGKLIALYSRLVEGYRVLCDSGKRGHYDKMLEQGKMRYSLEDERGAWRDPETEIVGASARRFYKMAKSAMMSGDIKTAVMNLKLALSAEPGSDLLKTELVKAQALPLKGK